LSVCGHFDILALSFFRHSSFGFHHLNYGSGMLSSLIFMDSRQDVEKHQVIQNYPHTMTESHKNTNIYPPRVIGIIPARYDASRFPGKLLSLLGGRTVIEHVYLRSLQARKLDEVYVATDDDRIAMTVKAFGGKVIRTSSNPNTGTERIAEACGEIEAEVVVNIQGDEPFLAGEMVDMVVEELRNDPELVVVTLMKNIENDSDFHDPNLVKVVVDRKGYALYFSRSPIPHGDTALSVAYKHIGLYGYRRDFLSRFTALPVGPLEFEERLEQLRVLENGYRIKVLETDRDTIGIDTPEDLERAAIHLNRLNGSNGSSRSNRSVT